MQSHSTRFVRKFKDITGKVSGNLTVTGFHGNIKGSAYWKCVCECGREQIKTAGAIKYTTKHKCACVNHYKKPGFRIWKAMNARCYNQKNHAYSNYGGRGISVCQEWRDSFLEFSKFFSTKPSGKHQMDRIDNDGNYEPSNVKWSTPKQNCRNTRRNILYLHDGKNLTLSEWSEICGVNYACLHARINKLKWSIERAVSVPQK